MKRFWVNELESGYYDKLFQNGIKNSRGFQANWHLTTFTHIKEYLNKDLNHLDYACGPGTLIGNFSLSESIGVDLSQKQIAYAQEKYPKFKFVGLEDFQFKDFQHKFHVITVLGLFEFLSEEEINEHLNRFFYMLRDGGKLVITTPNFSVFLRALLFLSQLIGKTKYNSLYVSKFKRKNLITFLEKQQTFDLVKVKNFINAGSLLSIFSHKFSKKLEQTVSSYSSDKYGLLLLAELRKNNLKSI